MSTYNSRNIVISLLFVSPKSVFGNTTYVKNLLDNLLAIDRDNLYSLVLTGKNNQYFKNRYKKYQNVKYYTSDIRRDIARNPLRGLSKLLAVIKNDSQAREEIIRKEIQNFVDKNNIDIIFFPSGHIYPIGLQKIKIITTILDLQHEYFPNNFPEKYLDHRKKDSVYSAHNSDSIIAISDFTKRSLVEKYKIDPDKIIVIYLAPQDMAHNERSQLNLPANFIFYPAAIWPHKNHKILIEAMNLLKFKFSDLHLVFTGSIKNKRLKEELGTLTESFGLKDRVHFLGPVLSGNMHLIYKHAKILAYPSSFEGFGIPLVEAFNYGVPVIASNNTSISEVVGTAGVLVETGNIQALADAIANVLSDDNLRQDLIRKGHERAKYFSWFTTAKKTLELFNSL